MTPSNLPLIRAKLKTLHTQLAIARKDANFDDDKLEDWNLIVKDWMQISEFDASNTNWGMIMHQANDMWILIS